MPDLPLRRDVGDPQARVLVDGDGAPLAVGELAPEAALPLAERLRDALPGMRLVVDAGPGSFKSKLKRADRSGALFCLLIGDEELAAAEVTVKSLRGEGQQRIPQEQLVSRLADMLADAGSSART